MKKILQNKNPNAIPPEEPTIKIIEGSSQWNAAYANYLQGRPPTESLHWESGVYCTVEKHTESQYAHWSDHPALKSKPDKKEAGAPPLTWKIIAFVIALIFGPLIISAFIFVPNKELMHVIALIFFFLAGFITRTIFDK